MCKLLNLRWSSNSEILSCSCPSVLFSKGSYCIFFLFHVFKILRCLIGSFQWIFIFWVNYSFICGVVFLTFVFFVCVVFICFVSHQVSLETPFKSLFWAFLDFLQTPASFGRITVLCRCPVSCMPVFLLWIFSRFKKWSTEPKDYVSPLPIPKDKWVMLRHSAPVSRYHLTLLQPVQEWIGAVGLLTCDLWYVDHVPGQAKSSWETQTGFYWRDVGERQGKTETGRGEIWGEEHEVRWIGRY